MVCNDIQVSVCIVTYNHEEFIADCLESLLSQKTNFKFEIIIGEDCSTDNTRAIIQNYANQYPELIIPLFYEKNVGAVENIKQVYKKAKGKYIAHLDGDDLALPNKLQKQFDILERNPSYNICSHNMVRIDKQGNDLNDDWVYPEGEYDLLGLYKRFPFFSHSSKMFRNKYNDEYWGNLFCEPNIMDVDVHVVQLADGNMWHIGENLGQYRMGVGVSFQFQKNIPVMLKGLSRAYERGFELLKDKKQKEQLKKYYASYLLGYSYGIAVHTNHQDLFKQCIRKSVQIKFCGLEQLIMLLLSYFPNFCFSLLRTIYKFRNKKQ